MASLSASQKINSVNGSFWFSAFERLARVEKGRNLISFFFLRLFYDISEELSKLQANETVYRTQSNFAYDGRMTQINSMINGVFS